MKRSINISYFYDDSFQEAEPRGEIELDEPGGWHTAPEKFRLRRIVCLGFPHRLHFPFPLQP